MPVIMEKRIIFEPGDILKITVHCSLCRRDFSIVAVESDSLRKCPLCGRDWVTVDSSEEVQLDRERTLRLIEGLARFRSTSYQERRVRDNIPWTIRLELPADTD